jgi:hypothetical protein
MARCGPSGRVGAERSLAALVLLCLAGFVSRAPLPYASAFGGVILVASLGLWVGLITKTFRGRASTR